jgi:hypothetical protein
MVAFAHSPCDLAVAVSLPSAQDSSNPPYQALGNPVAAKDLFQGFPLLACDVDDRNWLWSWHLGVHLLQFHVGQGRSYQVSNW